MRNTAKTGCVNYDYGCNACKVLERKSCVGCSFYSTAAESVKRLKKANERLRSLPTKRQLEIAEKYYGGVAKWATDNTGAAVHYD